MWILSFVGTKLGQMVVLALAVILVLFIAIQYIQSEEKDKVVNEIKLQNLETDRVIRDRIDENINDVREANPTRDGSTALDLLRDRQHTSGR